MGRGNVFRGTPEAEAERRTLERELASQRPQGPMRLAAAEVRDTCLRLGADDVGFVEVDRAALGDQSAAARRLLPTARSLISLMGTMNRENIAAPARSGANVSWHHTNEHLLEVAHDIARELNRIGVRAMVTSVGFPMEVSQLGSEPWQIAHKPVAVEAGLGHMGINRNVIHPRFGNFVLLETLVIDAELDTYGAPLDYNPCADCNLCVAACPVGAISRRDEFDFFACLNHNYREFLYGFPDWVETLAEAGSADDYRSKFRENETISLWQSLGFGPQYKSGYCMAVCPAGEDVIGPYLQDKRGYVDTYLRPLKDRPEPVYVQSGSRAERVASRNPAKEVRYIDYRVGLASVDNAIRGLQHMFDGRLGELEGTSVLCIVGEGDTESGKRLVLTVKAGALQRSEPAAASAPCDVTVTGPLPAWMELLNRAAAGAESSPGDLAVTGDTAAFDALLKALR